MPKKFEPEMRERPLRMLADAIPDHPNKSAAVRHVVGCWGSGVRTPSSSPRGHRAAKSGPRRPGGLRDELPWPRRCGVTARWVRVVAGLGLAHRDSWVGGQGPTARLIRQLCETLVFAESTSVGLDVPARSVATAAIDGDTGELFQC